MDQHLTAASNCRAKISRLIAILSELRKLENNSADSIDFHRIIEAIESDIYTLIQAMNSETRCESAPLQSSEFTAGVKTINVERSESSNSSKVDSGETFFHRAKNKKDQSTEIIANVRSCYRRENDQTESFSSSNSSDSEESDSISESDSDSDSESYSDSYSDSNSDSYTESFSSSD